MSSFSFRGPSFSVELQCSGHGRAVFVPCEVQREVAPVKEWNLYSSMPSALPMNLHGVRINDVVNLVSLRFLSLGQHFCSGLSDDTPVRSDLAGENISDAVPEMEHLALEVMHQSECHVPLELSLATS